MIDFEYIQEPERRMQKHVEKGARFWSWIWRFQYSCGYLKVKEAAMVLLYVVMCKAHDVLTAKRWGIRY